MQSTFGLVLGLPLLSVAFSTIFYRYLGRKWVSWISTAVVGILFLLILNAFLKLMAMPAHHREIEVILLDWIQLGTFKLSFAVLFDWLSGVMALVITFVGFLIHFYSIGYMSHDNGVKRFFIFLNLFIFAMLSLVLANNYLMLFLGWEGVGLCSYFLIGFWFHKHSAAGAAKKAFIVNRVGDFGLLVAIILLALKFNSLDFQVIFDGAKTAFAAGSLGIVLITLLMFLGVTGKSAQLPLYIWLPDAMEGPTPVSALIHAATMVTAGIYLMIRSHVLFELSPVTLSVVAGVGLVTALGAATMALVQTDLKKVLAYSTVSQLGYMTLACGLAAYTAALFHLVTHAFFKALLFLAAGSVIHGLHDEQDMRKMGGLRKYMPWTFMTFLVGAMALAGIPGLSGFFSKDEILASAFLSETNGHWLIWLVAVVTAFLTAFYTFRAVGLTFLGKEKFSKQSVPHESGFQMLFPLVILAIFAVGIGYLNVPNILGGHAAFHHYLEPLFHRIHEAVPFIKHEVDHGLELFILFAAVVFTLYAVFLGIRFYTAVPEIPKQFAQKFKKIYQLFSQMYYVDQIYQRLIVEPGKKLSAYLFQFWDEKVIAGGVSAFGNIWLYFSHKFRLIQTGKTSDYLLMMVAMILIILVVLKIYV